MNAGQLILKVRTVLSTVLAVLLVSAGFVLVSATTADAAGCARLVGTFRDGDTYAKVKNVCGHRIFARAVVNKWPDSGCGYIKAGRTRVFRTGGMWAPRADKAAVCKS